MTYSDANTHRSQGRPLEAEACPKRNGSGQPVATQQRVSAINTHTHTKSNNAIISIYLDIYVFSDYIFAWEWAKGETNCQRN